MKWLRTFFWFMLFFIIAFWIAAPVIEQIKTPYVKVLGGNMFDINKYFKINLAYPPSITLLEDITVDIKGQEMKFNKGTKIQAMSRNYFEVR